MLNLNKDKSGKELDVNKAVGNSDLETGVNVTSGQSIGAEVSDASNAAGAPVTGVESAPGLNLADLPSGYRFITPHTTPEMHIVYTHPALDGHERPVITPESAEGSGHLLPEVLEQGLSDEQALELISALKEAGNSTFSKLPSVLEPSLFSEFMHFFF